MTSSLKKNDGVIDRVSMDSNPYGFLWLTIQMNSRKNTGAMPIPTPILLKVRELAEMQAQVPPNLSLTKVAGSARKIVREKQTGFL